MSVPYFGGPHKDSSSAGRSALGADALVDSLMQQSAEVAAKKLIFRDDATGIEYQRIARLGRGRFAAVDKCVRIDSRREFALKRLDIFMGHVESKMAAERDLLSALNHANVVKLCHSFVSLKMDEFIMVLPLYHCDLGQLLEHAPFPLDFIKCIVFQALSALRYLHEEAHVIHRDIKANNLLVSSTLQVVVTDFGVAKQLSDVDIAAIAAENRRQAVLLEPVPATDTPMDCDSSSAVDSGSTLAVGSGFDDDSGVKFSPQMIIRENRPPELLMGAKVYDCSVDVWSMACVASRMCRGSGNPLFEGSADLAVVNCIYEMLGGEMNLKGIGVFDFFKFEPTPSVSFDTLLPAIAKDSDALKLFAEMLAFHPLHRSSAKEALTNPFLADASSLSGRLNLDDLVSSVRMSDDFIAGSPLKKRRKIC